MILNNITSGKHKILGKEIYGENISILNDSKYYYKIKENNNLTIDFFGMKAEIVPLITYSVVHLIAYFVLYYFKFKPSVLKYLFNNSFLTILYVIVSYTIMYYWIPKIMIYISNKLKESINRLLADKIPILEKK